MARLLYGTGLRLLEMLRLRVKDIDFARGQIACMTGKGVKDRVTMLPESLREPLTSHLAMMRKNHEIDLRAGNGSAPFPAIWRESIPTRTRSGRGNGYSPRRIFPSTRRRGGWDGITRRKRVCNGRSRRRWGGRISPSRRPVIRCVIRLPRIFWRRERTFAPCRLCWVIRMSAPPRFTPMSCRNQGWA